ncbi:hypothetical protein GNI_176100 [Gregarina niphandrodes]|uniref:Uncharacterized protein n=1 Tax=Gregarina niphandrodes TaxID=110365 RepID=A0A023AY18_GRENI|nr:hypothetical protein GNI_176100 [Gregarina niphandrodes]EZG43348.1 hypothetical protein GNI_176100 [Gregarina niphandrodes]|eukprot:XP_011133397.1 hypothetical protein GNI_176100 [Gregarina niphandrodes]
MQLWVFNRLRINDQTATLLFHPQTFHLFSRDNETQLFVAAYDKCIFIPRFVTMLHGAAFSTRVLGVRIAYLFGKDNFDSEHCPRTTKPVQYSGDLDPSTAPIMSNDVLEDHVLEDLFDCQKQSGYWQLKANMKRHGTYFDMAVDSERSLIELFVLLIAARTRSQAYHEALVTARLRAFWFAEIVFRPPPDLRKDSQQVARGGRQVSIFGQQEVSPAVEDFLKANDDAGVGSRSCGGINGATSSRLGQAVVDFLQPLVRPSLLRSIRLRSAERLHSTEPFHSNGRKLWLQRILSSVAIVPAQLLLDDPSNEFQSAWFDIFSRPVEAPLLSHPLPLFRRDELPVSVPCSFCHVAWNNFDNVLRPFSRTHLLHVDCALRSYYADCNGLGSRLSSDADLSHM